MRTRTIAVELRPMRQRCAARQPQAVAHTARHWRARGPRRAPHHNGTASELLGPSTCKKLMRQYRCGLAARTRRRGGGGEQGGKGRIRLKAPIYFSPEMFLLLCLSVPEMRRMWAQFVEEHQSADPFKIARSTQSLGRQEGGLEHRSSEHFNKFWTASRDFLIKVMSWGSCRLHRRGDVAARERR